MPNEYIKKSEVLDIVSDYYPLHSDWIEKMQTAIASLLTINPEGVLEGLMKNQKTIPPDIQAIINKEFYNLIS